MKQKHSLMARRERKFKDLGVWFTQKDPKPLKEISPGADIHNPTSKIRIKKLLPAKKQETAHGAAAVQFTGASKNLSPSHSRSRLNRPQAGKPDPEEDLLDESREISYQIRGKSSYFIMVEKLALKPQSEPAGSSEKIVALELKDYSGGGASRWKAEESGTFRKSCRGLSLAVWLLDKANQTLERCSSLQ